MNDPWPVSATLAAARAELLRPGAVTGGFRGVRVDVAAGELQVDFRWRLDPTAYRVSVALPASPATGPWTGLPATSAAQWVSEVSGVLGEELDTGLVRRAGRRRGPGVVELDPGTRRDPDAAGHQVDESRLLSRARASLDLATHGVGPGRTWHLVVSGGLIAWLAAHVDNAASSPVVGQAAVGWVGDSRGAARVDLFAADPDVPAPVGRLLAHHAVHVAAEAGATRVLTDVGHPALVCVGFRPAGGGRGFALDTAQLGLLPTVR